MQVQEVCYGCAHVCTVISLTPYLFFGKATHFRLGALVDGSP